MCRGDTVVAAVQEFFEDTEEKSATIGRFSTTRNRGHLSTIHGCLQRECDDGGPNACRGLARLVRFQMTYKSTLGTRYGPCVNAALLDL